MDKEIVYIDDVLVFTVLTCLLLAAVIFLVFATIAIIGHIDTQHKARQGLAQHCVGCKEYDEKRNRCLRFSDVIRKASDEISSFYKEELDCLDIIKEKNVNIVRLKAADTLEYYNLNLLGTYLPKDGTTMEELPLTEDEFKALKEGL